MEGSSSAWAQHQVYAWLSSAVSAAHCSWGDLTACCSWRRWSFFLSVRHPQLRASAASPLLMLALMDIVLDMHRYHTAPGSSCDRQNRAGGTGPLQTTGAALVAGCLGPQSPRLDSLQYVSWRAQCGLYTNTHRLRIQAMMLGFPSTCSYENAKKWRMGWGRGRWWSHGWGCGWAESGSVRRGAAVWELTQGAGQPRNARRRTFPWLLLFPYSVFGSMLQCS